MITDNIRTTIEPGLLGYCDLIHDLMVMQGFDGDLDELRVISGAGVQHYIFEPAYNRHEDTPRAHSWLSLLFNNFGFFESLRYFTGWSIRDFDRVSLPDAWKLMTFEMSEGRAVISADLVGGFQPALIVGLEQPRTVIARVRTNGVLEDARLDYSGRSNLQTDHSFENFFTIVRPSDGEAALAGPNRQKFELLRWITAHHHSEKEFFHETRENYASGARGFQRLRELATEAESDDELAYLADHLRFLEVGRGAASRVIEAWGQELGARIGSEPLTKGLQLAASYYGEVSLAAATGDVAAAEHAESKAVAALESTVSHFPGRFEPID